MSKKDYLVFAPPFRLSAGIRVMHLLAHHLNERGYSAFIPTDVVNPKLNNLIIRDRDEVNRLSNYWIKHEPIVVYPEVVPGNPTQYKRVVRYVLNKPGLLGGDTQYAPTEMVFAYNKYCQSFLSPKTPILEIPFYELELFHLPSDKSSRSGGVYFVYKGVNVLRVSDTETMRELRMDNPIGREELADLFRKTDIFYSYDNNSAIIQDARLCGCPTVIIPDPNLKLTKDDPIYISKNGLAWGNSAEEIQFARDTVHLFYNDYLQHNKHWEKQLNNFINITQEG